MCGPGLPNPKITNLSGRQALSIQPSDTFQLLLRHCAEWIDPWLERMGVGMQGARDFGQFLRASARLVSRVAAAYTKEQVNVDDELPELSFHVAGAEVLEKAHGEHAVSMSEHTPRPQSRC